MDWDCRYLPIQTCVGGYLAHLPFAGPLPPTRQGWVRLIAELGSGAIQWLPAFKRQCQSVWSAFSCLEEQEEGGCD